MKASDLFIKALEAEDVEYVFGIPGEENLDFLDSLSRSEIKLILTRHEQAAGFMAATYGRLTGKAGVCLSTLGPGATNFVTASAYAQLGGMPMMMITGQKPVKTSKQGQFQIVDIVDMMRPLTKYTRQLVSGANIPSRVREAFRLAQEEKPGAVHLELPEDIAAEETDEPVIPASLVRRPIAEEKSVRAAVERIQNAKHPFLIVGAGANRKMTCNMLRTFVDRFGIPFVTTQMGKGVVDERGPLFLGNATLSAGDFVHRAAEASAADSRSETPPQSCMEALNRLIAGNERFVAGELRHPHLGNDWRKRLTGGQQPFATILGCSDSRVPPELLFDQGFGDLFVIRVAGNVIDTDVTGSVEYGVDHLSTQVVIVMGHDGCGAVTAALHSEEHLAKEPNEIRSLVGKIKPAIVSVRRDQAFSIQLRQSVEANVRASVRLLLNVPDLARSVKDDKTKIIGCVYDIDTGRVRTLDTQSTKRR